MKTKKRNSLLERMIGQSKIIWLKSHTASSRWKVQIGEEFNARWNVWWRSMQCPETRKRHDTTSKNVKIYGPRVEWVSTSDAFMPGSVVEQDRVPFRFAGGVNEFAANRGKVRNCKMCIKFGEKEKQVSILITNNTNTTRYETEMTGCVQTYFAYIFIINYIMSYRLNQVASILFFFSENVTMNHSNFSCATHNLAFKNRWNETLKSDCPTLLRLVENFVDAIISVDIIFQWLK